jgi:hypothetical protein
VAPNGERKKFSNFLFVFFLFSFSTVTNCFFIHLKVIETRRKLFTKEIVISSAIVGGGCRVRGGWIVVLVSLSREGMLAWETKRLSTGTASLNRFLDDYCAL